jgi:murein DD-endopeptidase MepM/ murein hydrolase activator NlpD
VFSSRLSRPNKTGDWTGTDIVGEFITQGEQVMEAGDTGVSAYNHLHTHVAPLFDDTFERNYLLTIPFLYEDHGVLKAMDYYTSNNDGT